MRRYLKLLALVGVLAIVAAACGDGDEDAGDAETTTPPATEEVTEEPGLLPGGELNLLMLADDGITYDPQKEYYSVTWSFFRCCLLRTLMSYRGLASDQGGTEVLPDLAAEDPTVSADGLTWTFKIREGVKYAPPLADVEITAQDFIRAMEREATGAASPAYGFYYTPVIEGMSEFEAGEADTISGLVAMDDKTLEVHLTAPTGDLPFRMAMPASAPIPEGVADGHDEDYGRFLIASGPYMFEGADALDFSGPPKQQEPVAGFDPGRAHILVRNTSWDPATDPLRGEFAFADQINIIVGGTEEDAQNKIDNGEADALIDGVHPGDAVREYQTNPDLKDQIFIFPSDAVRYLSMNVASPPFDDVHVRKALNWIIDKDGMRRLRPGGELGGEIAEHIMVPGVLGALLADYAPYASANNQGDLAAAQEEIKLSKYDKNGDGSCEESPECKKVLAVTDEGDPYPDQAALISENVAQLGITLDIKQFDRGTMYDKCNDPAAHVTFCLAPGWGKDYANATTFAEPLFGDSALGPSSCCNYAVMGATPEQLAEWGYTVSEVPSVDEKITECDPLIGGEQTQCWAELDQLLMEEAVPWVPYLFDNNIDIISANVVPESYAFDQFSGLAAWEKFALVAFQG